MSVRQTTATLAREGHTSPNCSARRVVSSLTVAQKIIRCVFFISLLAFELINSTTHATADINLFSFFGRICISVYNLEENHSPVLRDDLSNLVSPRLEQETKQLNKWLAVLSRPNCIKPNDRRFQSQLMLELFVKRQNIQIDGDEFKVAIVGGSSSNGKGRLSDYELQPIVIVKRQPIEESSIAETLFLYVKRVVLPIMKN